MLVFFGGGEGPRKNKVHLLNTTVALYSIIYETYFIENKTPKSNWHCGTRLVPHIKAEVHNNELYYNENTSVTKPLMGEI